MSTVGLLSIGQSPRSDLTDPLRILRPDLTFIEAGALDGLTADDLPSAAGDYPLSTRLRSGAQVTVDQSVLEPLLQQALDHLETQGVVASMLLCAGTFAALQGERPLLKPFPLVNGLLRATGIQHIGVVCPFAAQEPAIRQRWHAAGYEVKVGTAALTDAADIDALLASWIATERPVDGVVLDYVGHDPALVRKLQARQHLPIYDLGLTTMTILVHTVPA